MTTTKRKLKSPRRSGRLNLIIDEDLKRWAQQYAQDHHTNLTSILTAYLIFLRNREKTINAEQI